MVSAIVTTRNSAGTLEACLRSLRNQTHPGLEIVVVDNASTDATVEIAGRYANSVKQAAPERSAQRNYGARIASGEYLLFIDSDMELAPEVVADCVATIESTGMPAVIIPEISIGEGFWAKCRALERSCYVGDDRVEAARCYRRDAFERVGGFDENLTGAEDWDLSRRVAVGLSLPRTKAVISHNEGRTKYWSALAKKYYYAPGYWHYVRKHGPGTLGQALVVLRAVFLSQWRRLARQPLLAGGVVLLKGGELAAMAVGGLTSARPDARRSDANAAVKTRDVAITPMIWPLVPRRPSSSRVAIVIPNHNGAQILPDCLKTVTGAAAGALGYPDVIVVDDQSTDESLEICRRDFPEVTVLSLTENVGFGWACDAAIRATEADYCLLLNTDAWLKPGTLQALCDYADRGNFAIVGPRILNLDGTAQSSGLTVDFLGEPGRAGPGKNPLYVSGAVMLLRRKDYLALGGFDKRFFMFFEESDLQWRARLTGRRVGYLDSVEAVHMGGGTITGGLPNPGMPYRVSSYRLYLGRRNQMAMLLKNYSASSLVYVLPLWMASAVLECLGGLAIGQWGHFLIYARALWWNLWNVPETFRLRRVIQSSRVCSDLELMNDFGPPFTRLRLGIRMLRHSRLQVD